MGCSPKEATIFCRRNHPAGMKPVNGSETSEHKNICEHLIFKVHMHIFVCHAYKTLQNFESPSKPVCGAPAILSFRQAEPPTQGMPQTGAEIIPRTIVQFSLLETWRQPLVRLQDNSLFRWSKRRCMMLAQKKNRKNLIFAKHFSFSEITQHWKSLLDENQGKISTNTKKILLLSEIILSLFWN